MKHKGVGILPCPQWLRSNGYSGLCEMMRKHPEAFAHIPQDRKRQAAEESVPVAERLAAQNGGTLSNPKWLQQNGYGALAAFIRRHPEAFAHIPQDRKRQAAEESVPVAERLAAQNGGMLPNPRWLQQNGYGRLDHAMRKRPQLFAHIRQGSKKGRRPEEWVLVAKRLMKKDDRLPSPGWLRHNGYGALNDAMRRCPEMFAHIQQEHKLRVPEEWVSVAERLAKTYGLLPHCGWRQRNGYQRLDAVMRKHPDLFAHIPQKRLR